MFNLIVSYEEWHENNGRIDKSRIYLRDNEKITELFATADGTPCYDRLRLLPALLMEEVYDQEPKPAKVATIKEINVDKKFVYLDYIIENVPTITNTDFKHFSEKISLNRRALDHTHWEVVDYDLYRLLLTAYHAKRFSPKVFSLDNAGPTQASLISVMMPFALEFTPTYEMIKEAAKSVGLEAIRADDIWDNQVIIQKIVTLIAKSNVVISDCTGRNPNVFYETGIAHTLGK